MDETYRMLGKEHEADLEREAQRRHLAAELRGRSSADRSAERELDLLADADRIHRRPVRSVPSRHAAETKPRAKVVGSFRKRLRLPWLSARRSLPD
jgi:hypothetical protein